MVVQYIERTTPSRTCPLTTTNLQRASMAGKHINLDTTRSAPTTISIGILHLALNHVKSKSRSVILQSREHRGLASHSSNRTYSILTIDIISTIVASLLSRDTLRLNSTAINPVLMVLSLENPDQMNSYMLSMQIAECGPPGESEPRGNDGAGEINQRTSDAETSRLILSQTVVASITEVSIHAFDLN